MPPEWAPHLACYLAWPHNRDTWPGKFDVIPPIYADMVAKIARFDPVRLAVTDETQIDQVREMILEAAAPHRKGHARCAAADRHISSADQRRVGPRPRPDFR